VRPTATATATLRSERTLVGEARRGLCWWDDAGARARCA
jgi:hypothetical protein